MDDLIERMGGHMVGVAPSEVGTKLRAQTRRAAEFLLRELMEPSPAMVKAWSEEIACGDNDTDALRYDLHAVLRAFAAEHSLSIEEDGT